ncbi:hypothetical protein Tco_0997136 [Tanacetum coccineum]
MFSNKELEGVYAMRFEEINAQKFQDEFKVCGFSTVKTARTPMETSKPLLKDAEAKDVDVHLYRSMIGSLMYLTASRPDITFVVYSPFDLEAYTDSDYVGASLDRKSTGDDTVIKGVEDKMEGLHYGLLALKQSRELASGSGPRCQDTILGGAEAQIRFKAASKQLNDPPLLRVNILRSGEDCMKLKELMEFYTKLFFWATAKAKTVNGERQIQALVDKKKVIINEKSVRSDLMLEDAEGTKCLPNDLLDDMGEDSTAPSDSYSTPIITQPSSSKPQNKKSRRKQRKDSGPTEPIPDEATNAEPISTPSYDPPQSGEDRLQLTELMSLYTKLQKKIANLDVDEEVTLIDEDLIFDTDVLNVDAVFEEALC